MRPPSGLNAALFIQNLCPDSIAVTAPVCAFHTRALLSQDDVTTLTPSGLKAALLTRPVCPPTASRKVQSCAEPKNDRSSCRGRDRNEEGRAPSPGNPATTSRSARSPAPSRKEERPV